MKKLKYLFIGLCIPLLLGAISAYPGLMKIWDGTDTLGVNSDGSVSSQITDGNNTATVNDYNAVHVCNISSGLAISSGVITGRTKDHKFGFAPDFDFTDGEVTVWDGADDASIDQMVYQYSTTADINSISSSSGSDTGDVLVLGLDANGVEAEQTVTLNGQTRVELSTALQSVYRMENEGTSDFAGFVYCYVNTAITAGVPDDPTKVRAIVDDGNNQTEMAIRRVPSGNSGFIRSIYASPGGANKSTGYIIRLKVRSPGGVFKLKHRFVVNDGENPYLHTFVDPKGPYEALSDIQITAELNSAGTVAASVAAGFDVVFESN